MYFSGRTYLWWSLCTLYLHACQVSYHRQFRSLLYLCCTFLALINSLVCWFCTRILGLILFQSCFLCSGFFMSLPHRWCLLTHDVGFFVCLLVWCFCLKKELRRKMIPYYDKEMNVGWKMNIWKYDKQR